MSRTDTARRPSPATPPYRGDLQARQAVERVQRIEARLREVSSAESREEAPQLVREALLLLQPIPSIIWALADRRRD
jgi:hypothetical protein